jgi:hypothetical protein
VSRTILKRAALAVLVANFLFSVCFVTVIGIVVERNPHDVWLAIERYDASHDMLPDWLWNGGIPFNHLHSHGRER